MGMCQRRFKNLISSLHIEKKGGWKEVAQISFKPDAGIECRNRGISARGWQT